MINQNMQFQKIGDVIYSLLVSGEEISKLYDKYQGWANVKISKPESPGTEKQNRAMHALLTEYYKTGMHSAPPGYTLDMFKIFMKLRYGPAYQIELEGKTIKVPKSWSDYSKQERMEFIDGLISEIKQSGASAVSWKIQEILAGMEESQ